MFARPQFVAVALLFSLACGGIAIAEIPGSTCTRCSGAMPFDAKSCPSGAIGRQCLVQSDGTCGYQFPECSNQGSSSGASSGVTGGIYLPPGLTCNTCSGPQTDDARLCAGGVYVTRSCVTDGNGGCSYEFPPCPGSASSSSGSTSGSTSSTGGPPPDNVAIVCNAVTSQDSCPVGNEPVCTDYWKCLAKQMTASGASAFASCHASPACGTQDRCLIASGQQSDPAGASSYLRACAERQRQCGTTDVPQAYCTPAVFAFASPFPESIRKCLTSECSQIRSCFTSVSAPISACK
jgi:hypothetical protein